MTVAEVALVAPQMPAVSFRPLYRNGCLSERERAVLSLISDGHSNEDVAAALGLSPFTIKSMLPRMARKMGVPNDRAGMVALALRTGQIT